MSVCAAPPGGGGRRGFSFERYSRVGVHVSLRHQRGGTRGGRESTFSEILHFMVMCVRHKWLY